MGMVISIALGGAIGSLGRYVTLKPNHALDGAWILVWDPDRQRPRMFHDGRYRRTQLRSPGISRPETLRLPYNDGILGGFTTFSAFALDTAVLSARGDMTNALLYVGGSVGGSVIALFLGLPTS